MERNFKLIALLSFGLAACSPREATPVDPFGEAPGSGAIGRILTCEAKDAAGNCLKKSCKQDARGDCETYAGYCIGAGEHWSGTKEGGACSKVL